MHIHLCVTIGAPVETISNGQTTVTLTQTSEKALATWYKFNVGAKTTVYFDQSAGNSSNGNNSSSNRCHEIRVLDSNTSAQIGCANRVAGHRIQIQLGLNSTQVAIEVIQRSGNRYKRRSVNRATYRGGIIWGRVSAGKADACERGCCEL